MAAKRHRIAVIPGDGIGQEVIPAALTVLEAVASRSGFTFDLVEFPYGCAYYAKHGRMMAADAFERLAEFPAIYFGAVGDPSVPDHIAVWELILPLRQRFDQYVNLRPMRLFPGVTLAARQSRPRRHRHDLRARELRGRVRRHRRQDSRRARRTKPWSRRASSRGTASAASRATRSSWRRSGRGASSRARRSRTRCSTRWCCGTRWSTKCARTIPGVAFKKYHVDALAARMVTHPQTLDVIVASNLFGDILTDLGAAISGSLGLAASGNINPERKYPSMFEPIHGSAPDIKGKGIANPIGAIWAGALMLDHLGEPKAHDADRRGHHEGAVERRYENAGYGREGQSTKEMAAAIQAAIVRI